ncbi:hypothetical protein JQK88_01535 [Mesorhizobium caraganae]|uniref:hypothetical protein n=1 Tax=Mesorhizobium caraganae TaxID=483206 RepID=UPI00177D4CDD|nr:hypothetical protein [Mesorhizobium caraganae]MBM2709934.1 hypothetical protein [Mesorhizobium caraganae]
MAMLFGPLNSDGRKRSLLYHAARLSMLHDRMLMRFDKVDDAADKVQQRRSCSLKPLDLSEALKRSACERQTSGHAGRLSHWNCRLRAGSGDIAPS